LQIALIFGRQMTQAALTQMIIIMLDIMILIST